MAENAVTAEELAVTLRCSVEKVYRLARSGDIPGFRVGREWRFFPDKVVQRLEAPKDIWEQPYRARRRVA